MGRGSDARRNLVACDRVKHSGNRHQEKWKQFGDGEDVADLRPGSHAAKVDEGKHPDEQREDKKSRDGFAGMGPELGEIDDE